MAVTKEKCTREREREREREKDESIIISSNINQEILSLFFMLSYFYPEINYIR